MGIQPPGSLSQPLLRFRLISVRQVLPGSDSALPVCRALHQVSGHQASLLACLSHLAPLHPALEDLLLGKPIPRVLH